MEIWVLPEDELARAVQLLDVFRQNPDADRYLQATETARDKRRAQEKKEHEYQRRLRKQERVVRRMRYDRIGTVTLTLIIISVAVTLVSRLGTDTSWIRPLFISDYVTRSGIPWWRGLPEIKSGQVWRLVTPIFVHFGIAHILFNMLWLRDLGSAVEKRAGSLFLTVLVLVVAVVSNVAQYAISGPNFGGMSGVVYALLGYVWMQSRYNPSSGYYLHPTTVIMMIAWFFLCFTGIFGPVANTIHAIGLGIGVIWGYAAATTQRRI
jgi:GlpG protein